MKTKTLALLAAVIVASCSPSLGSQPERAIDPLLNPGRNYYVAFTDSHQKSQGDIAGDPDATVYGRAGSVFQTTLQGVKMLTGCLLFESGDRQLLIQSKLANLKLDNKSRIIIEDIDDRETITLLTGALRLDTGETRKVITQEQTIQLNKESGGQTSTQLMGRVFAGGKRNLDYPRPACLVAKDGSGFSVNENEIHIASGSVLTDLPKGTSIVTPGGTVRASQRSTVSVRMMNNTLCVENCSVPSAVAFTVKGITLNLDCGRACILKRGRPSGQMVPLDGVARRCFSARFDGEVTAILSDFELTTLLCSNAAFRSAAKFPITRQEAKLAQALIKNAALMGVVLANHGDYCSQPVKMPVYRLGMFHESLAQLKPSAI